MKETEGYHINENPIKKVSQGHLPRWNDMERTLHNASHRDSTFIPQFETISIFLETCLLFFCYCTPTGLTPLRFTTRPPPAAARSGLPPNGACGFDELNRRLTQPGTSSPSSFSFSSIVWATFGNPVGNAPRTRAPGMANRGFLWVR